MRKIRELLRLRREQNLSQRVTANSLRLSQASVSDYLSRARCAGLTWPLPDGLDDAQLEALLFPPLPDVPSDQRPVPDWSAVHRDLRRPNVTLALLWEEYRAATTDGFGYSWFCEIIGDPTLGDAILDRVIHRSHRIELKGESLRKRQALAAVEGLTNAKEK